jgi:hypothetical protein
MPGMTKYRVFYEKLEFRDFGVFGALLGYPGIA